MDCEFIIPLSKDDLLCATEGAYIVDEVFSIRSLPAKLNDAVDELKISGPCSILGQFDVFYSVSKHFAELSNELKFNCWKCLHKALIDHVSDLIALFHQEPVDRDIKKQHRNTLKMLSYLLTQFTEEFEAEDCKPTTASVSRGRGKKPARKVSFLPFDWPKVKEEFLTAVTHLLEINIVSLWEPPVLEEEFVNTFANCCYKFLENPAVNRDKTLRDSILNIIGILVKKYNHCLSVCVKVIQLLQHFEHMVSPMAQLVQVCASEHGVANMVMEILREIGQIDARDLARDTSGTKCYSEFLVELASKIPEYVLPNISLLLCHLDGESYTMRNGVLGVMGTLVISCLSRDELDNNLKKTRDRILDCLEEHIHDVNAFVRSKVLQIWQNICRAKAIPLARQQYLLTLVNRRLKDKSSLVRKNAVILLKEFLMSNPFRAQLPLAQVMKKLAEEKEKLKRMAPELVDDDDQVSTVCTTEDLKHWLKLECDIKRVVVDHWAVDDIEDEDGEHVEFQGDVNEALSYALINVKKHLVSGDFLKALAILKAAIVTWPDYSMFSDAEAHKGTMASDDEATKNKEETVKREMLLLKKIFLNPDFGSMINQIGDGEARKTSEAVNESDEMEKLVNEVTKQQIIVQYLKDYMLFHIKLQDALVIICELLGSKTISDVQEAVEFLVIAKEFGLDAMHGVRKMLALVWSKENAINQMVIEAYTRLYLNPQASGQGAKTEAIVCNLIKLTRGTSVGELASLDELVYKLMKNELVPKKVIHLLWEKFTMKAPQTTPDESRAAVNLLGMMARAEREIVRSNVEVLVNVGLGDRAKDDPLLVRDTCTVLLRLNGSGKKMCDDKQAPYRLSSDHDIFQRLSDILTDSITSPLGGMWIPQAEEAINVIYQLAEHPDVICSKLVKKFIDTVFCGGVNSDAENANKEASSREPPSTAASGSVMCTARLFAVVGHVALCQAVHLDTCILGEIKRRERVKEDEEGKQKNRGQIPSSRSTTVGQTPRAKDWTSEAIEDEMGLTGSSAEDNETEYIKKICDHEIVTGGSNLLSLIGPVIVSVCNNPVKYADLQLQAAASLALGKFMLVSAEFCEKNLQLLFTILEKSPHPVIRANTIICLGDLTSRFPNLIEPWTPNLYARLRDDSCQVRKNTLTIMTHLILNDMVKVKGQISEMATCLEDKESRIADLAKLFFSELSKKGNAVYNILPDVISRLSDPETGVEETPFRNIMRYLFSFIQKDRQCESLIEKLCHRFRATRTERQWLDLSFCLAQLSYNERGVRKLQENFACYQDKLSNDEVYGFFSAIVSKCKKFAKPELKVLVEELESRIVACHEKGVEDEAGYERANQASAAARILARKTVNTPGNRKTRNTKGRTAGSRRRRKDSEADILPKTTQQSAKKSARKSRKKVIEFDSDDEESLQDDGDWNDVSASDESGNEENVEPNVRTGRSTQKGKYAGKAGNPRASSRTFRI